jgi:hypothetical protein
MRKIAAVLKKVNLKDYDEKQNDLEYWLSKTPLERLAALTLLVRQNLKPGQRMDKTKFSQRKMHR